MVRAPVETQTQINGLLPFMATPFAADGGVDLPCYREHLRYLLDAHADKPSCFFVCCGTGELWSLELEEYAALVRAAVDEVGTQVPIVAGVGYGTRLAAQFARAAAKAEADALLVFPPYLASGPQEGLYAHYAAIAQATPLAVMVYNRDNAVFEPETLVRLVEAHPNVIGLKDGHGDLKQLGCMRELLGEAFLIMNGMPTAETYAKPYTQAGVRPYSPSGIEFLPELAWPLDHALARMDVAEIDRLIDGFYLPYAELRQQVRGYGVSLIKAGLALRGRPVGGVRPPLVDPTPAHVSALEDLIARGLALV